MNTWIRANHDFGLPCLRLIVRLRSEAGTTLMRRLSTTDDPELIAKTCKELIVESRPNLLNCSVVSMFMRNFGSVEIAVYDASLPKVMMMDVPQEVLLEPCAVCRSNIEANARTWNKFVNDRCVTVCSQECLDKPMKALTQAEHDKITWGWSALDEAVLAAAKPRLKKYQDDNNRPKLKKHDGGQTFNAATLPNSEWIAEVPRCSHHHSDGNRCEMTLGHEGSHMHRNGSNWVVRWLNEENPPSDPAEVAKEITTFTQSLPTRIHLSLHAPAMPGFEAMAEHINEFKDKTCKSPSCVRSFGHEGDCKTAEQIADSLETTADMKVDQVLSCKPVVGTFRCSKCGKLKLMRECAAIDNLVDHVCKTCVAEDK